MFRAILGSPFARAGILLVLVLLSGCADSVQLGNEGITPPQIAPVTSTGSELDNLPPPARKVDVAVYSFNDQTGQQKPSDNFADFSKAVTQGGAAILVDVLQHVANARWFNVVERINLKDLLTERGLIDQTNHAYRGTTKSVLPPLRFAGIIINGGIVDYDSNIVTGGWGASLLGIGASQKYRRDRISVVLRAVSVNTGLVLDSVQTEKTVYSVLTQGNVFQYVTSDRLLQLEAGQSRNEPTGIAVRKAIEEAVYSLIIQGSSRGLWSFADHAAQERLIRKYEGSLTQEHMPAPSIETSSVAASPAAATATN